MTHSPVDPDSRATPAPLHPPTEPHPRLLGALLAVLAFLGVGTTGRALEFVPWPESTVDELTWVEVIFDGPVGGGRADDLLVNGLPAASLLQPAPDRYLFNFAQPSVGLVRFTWSPAHAITGDDGVPFDGDSWTLTLDPAASRRSLVISEFMADNDRTLLDDDCDRPDWIEIHNTGSTPVNLGGWALTDDRADLGKWHFPPFALEANVRLVVFASQKDKTNLAPRVATACRNRTNAVVGFHTNFKLDPDGEYLALVAPNGEVISEFAPVFPPQRRDVGFGLLPGGANQVAYFTRPTPGAPNAGGGPGFSPPVTFGRPSGTFLHGFSLVLTCEHTNAVIRYTLDGTFPGETNRALLTYRSPLRISNTTQVRARATVPGLLPGQPASETYIALTNQPGQLATFHSTLPIVVISTLRTLNIRDSINTPAHFTVFAPRDGRTSLRDPPEFTTRGGIKTRGSSTGGQPQSNFAVEWWDEFDQDRDHPILGMPEDSEWVLYAPNEYDAALIHNPFTMEISHRMNFKAPRTRFVEVYLNKGGPLRTNDWFGLYVLMEKPGLSKYRIDAPKAQPEDTEFPEVTGSYLFKTDRLDPSDGGFTAAGVVNAYVEPKEREMKAPQRAPQLAYLTKFFRDLDTALRPTNPNYNDPVLGFRGYLDVTNWMDFHILETLSGQVDAIRLSTYFYKRREGKLEYGPRWDYDRAWESKADSRDDNPRNWNTSGSGFGAPWWDRVLANRDAWQVWIDRWQHFRPNVLSQSNLFLLIDQLTNTIGTVQARENRRWTATAPRGTYRNEIGIMKTWISNRLVWLDGQMAQPPIPSHPGGSVPAGFRLTLATPTNISSAANVAIYYTLDGSDPRPPGGTNTPTASRYTGPISIAKNTRVVARLRDSGRSQRGGPLTTTPWSAPVELTLVTDAPRLALTELMFHPAPPPPGSPFSEDDFEFLELRNTSATELNLVGYRFTEGIQFQFTATNAVTRLAPGARVLLVRDRAAFLSRYPDISSIGGEFQGGLLDAGERLALQGPLGETVFDFVYGDQWFPASDGLGFSIALRDENVPASQLASPAAWRLSQTTGGSPAHLDSAPAAIPPVYIHEVLARPAGAGDDWIELHNPGDTTVDVSGWWITDDLEVPTKVRLPVGSLLAPRGFLVLDAALLRDGTRGFSLDGDGDGAWLLSADATGALTGWVHGFQFEGSDPGISFGRELGSDGRDHFVAQSRPTPGQANVGPRIGPVLIAEFSLTRSLPSLEGTLRDQFIELLNLTASPVPLYDVSAPNRTWRVRGDVEFDFPPNLTLPPYGRLVLVGFDPATDSLALEAFRLRYPPTDSGPIVGPWRGQPDPARSHFRLLQPTLGSTAESFVVIDSVSPRTEAPWPADLARPGRSLARASATGLSDDPAQWRLVRPTPGEADFDFDGLPDPWEQAWGLDPRLGTGANGGSGDPDGDGFSNDEEHTNGTDPLDPRSAFAIRFLAEPDGRLVFLVRAATGRQLSLEASTGLAPESWQATATQTAAADRPLVFLAEPTGGTPAFYRISAR